MKRWLLILSLLVLSACTTDSYIKGDGTRVTVKKFAGIPYLEEDVKTTSEPVGL
jgi:hypothetical protein